MERHILLTLTAGCVGLYRTYLLYNLVFSPIQAWVLQICIEEHCAL